MLEKLIKALARSSEKVIDTKKMEEKHIELWNKLEDKCDEIIKLREEKKQMGKEFWHLVEGDFGLIGKNLQVNRKTKAIEILEDEK